MYLHCKSYLYVCCSQDSLEFGKVAGPFQIKRKLHLFYATCRIWLHNTGNTLLCLCPRLFWQSSVWPVDLGCSWNHNMYTLCGVRKQRDSKSWTCSRKGGVSSILCVLFIVKSELVLLILLIFRVFASLVCEALSIYKMHSKTQLTHLK